MISVKASSAFLIHGRPTFAAWQRRGLDKSERTRPTLVDELKFKAVHEQEVVIVGYTEPRRSRKYFGALVLAVRDSAGKRWIYAGHVGTGFDQAPLKSLHATMQLLRTDKRPFKSESERRGRDHLA